MQIEDIFNDRVPFVQASKMYNLIQDQFSQRFKRELQLIFGESIEKKQYGTITLKEVQDQVKKLGVVDPQSLIVQFCQYSGSVYIANGRVENTDIKKVFCGVQLKKNRGEKDIDVSAVKTSGKAKKRASTKKEEKAKEAEEVEEITSDSESD